MFFRKLGEAGYRFRYAIIGAWLLTAVVLNIVIPQLEEVIKRDSTPFLPASSEAMSTYRVMGEKFGGASGHGFAMVVLESKQKFSAADEAYYTTVVERIRSHHERVESVEDYVSHPEVKPTLVSKDGKAVYIPVAPEPRCRHARGRFRRALAA